ncbi:nuclease [Nocardia coubleae]|uniref:Nuclease n=1 Tax=Nocardia coubleae TaxID=356147 RepID=A0A846WAL2_9NOCA|nr:nuclease [Nocardia coubleae]NKX90135.1 nuclease [Nocardia coubleae]
MPFLLISGVFVAKGAAPDGDSVRFRPDDPALWDRVGGPHRVKRNASGAAQLRLDGIDSLETHYTPRHGTRTHQPLPLARAAADELLAWLGFTGVVRNDSETVTSTDQAVVPGFILTRGADLHGRCVAFAGRGPAPGSSGAEIFVDVALLRLTLNHHQLATGLAYPTFYRSLFPALRAEFTAVSEAAAVGSLGVWAADATTTGAAITSPSSLSDDIVVLPKLFRRLADYLELGDGDLSLDGFPAFLAQAADRFFIISTGHSTTGLDAITVIDGSTVRLTHPPTDLVFDEN